MAGTLGITETSLVQPDILAGDVIIQAAETIKSGEGELAGGAVLARNFADSKFYALDVATAVEDEVLAAAEAGAAGTDVTDEVLAAADGSRLEFAGFLANTEALKHTLTVKATVGSASKEASAAADGFINTADVTGYLDWTTGYYHLSFVVAPDNATNVTADYTHGYAAAVTTYEGDLAHGPVIPGSVTIKGTFSAEEATLTEDGLGHLSGAAGSGTVIYGQDGAAHVQVTWSTAPDAETNITVDYEYGAASELHKPAGILLTAEVDATSADAAAQVLKLGAVRAAALVWPDAVSAAHKAWALKELTKLGVHAV